MFLLRERFRLAASITLLVEIFLFSSSVLAVAVENCTSLPLAVPITNVTLSTGSPRRGIPISIGTPAQTFSLKLSTTVNNTVFKQGPITSTNCENSTDDRCIMVKGGIYNRDLSSSWSGPMTKQEFLHDGATDSKSIDILGQETMEISGSDFGNIPIGIEDGSDITTSSIGLGSNSSLINNLLASGNIPSRVWGLDWGWTGGTTDTWADGSLVLGGYDKSRIKDGKLYTQDFPVNLGDSDGCALIVYITGINMKNSTSELELMESKGDSLRACVAPDYDLITMPYTLFKKFNDAMDDVYVNRTVGDFTLWGFESDVKDGYTGSMIIKLSNGLTITIPNHELVQPYRNYDTNGKPVISKANKNVLMLNSLQQVNENDLPLLGLPFLSSTYLVVDPDQGRFLLGESQRSTTPDLVAGSIESCPENSASLPTGTGSLGPTSTSPGSSSTSGSDPDSDSGSSKGAVIGGTIGGIAAVGLIAVLAFVFWKRSKKRKVQELESNPPAETMHMVGVAPPLGELDGNSPSESMHMVGGDQGEYYQSKGTVSYELPSNNGGYAPQSPHVYEADSNPVTHYTDNRT